MDLISTKKTNQADYWGRSDYNAKVSTLKKGRTTVGSSSKVGPARTEHTISKSKGRKKTTVSTTAYPAEAAYSSPEIKVSIKKRGKLEKKYSNLNSPKVVKKATKKINKATARVKKQ